MTSTPPATAARSPAPDTECADFPRFEPQEHPRLNRTALAAEVKRLSRVSVWRGAAAIAFEWAMIAGCAWAAIASGHWLVYLAAMVVIATRQHALAVLMHDAAHYRLFPSRLWNDLMGDLCCAFPLSLSLALNRKFHFAHHRWTLTPEDPEVIVNEAEGEDDWPRIRAELWRTLLGDLLGLHFFKLFSAYPFTLLNKLTGRTPDAPTMTPGGRALAAGYLLAVLGTLWLTGGWLPFLLLWVLPMATILVVILRLRAIAEHSGVGGVHELNVSRSTIPNWLERFLIAPCHVNYHLEHHLFPSVPFYNLPALHRRLMQEEVFRTEGHRTQGYLSLSHGVLAEVTRPQ